MQYIPIIFSAIKVVINSGAGVRVLNPTQIALTLPSENQTGNKAKQHCVDTCLCIHVHSFHL